MSAMGERFLILEETADALDVIDPELATQFRVVNGLPSPTADAVPAWNAVPTPAAPPQHEIDMKVSDDQIRSACSCGEWASVVGWDQLDTLVVRIREHLGTTQATTRDGIPATDGSAAAPELGRRAG